MRTSTPESRFVLRPSMGYTLIEVLIVVAILGIIAALAIPNYREYVQRGHMSEAKVNLVGLSMILDEYKAINDTYCKPAVPALCPQGAVSRFVYNYKDDGNGNVVVNDIDWVPFRPKQAASGKALHYWYQAEVGMRAEPGAAIFSPYYILRAMPHADRGAKPWALELVWSGEKTCNGNGGWNWRDCD